MISKWKQAQIDKGYIKAKTEYAIMVQCPRNKAPEYYGYNLWISTELVREGDTPGFFTISYKDDFKFRLTQYVTIRGQQIVSDTKEIDVAEFERIFDVRDYTELLQRKGNDQ